MFWQKNIEGVRGSEMRNHNEKGEHAKSPISISEITAKSIFKCNTQAQKDIFMQSKLETYSSNCRRTHQYCPSKTLSVKKIPFM